MRIATFTQQIPCATKRKVGSRRAVSLGEARRVLFTVGVATAEKFLRSPGPHPTSLSFDDRPLKT